GWRLMSLAMAGVALALLPLVAVLMRDRPEDVGLEPYGQQPGARRTSPTAAQPLVTAFRTLGIGLRSRDFWLIAGSYFIRGASPCGPTAPQLLPACIDKRIGDVAAATLLASMAVFNVIGTTASGWLSDRMDSRLLLAIYYGLRGASLLCLPFSFVSFYGLS